MTKLQLIGIGGTNGAGKDTVGQLLAKHHGYLFVSVTELLRSEAKRRGLPVERRVLRSISAEWRRQLGLGVLIDKAVAEFETVADKYSGLVIASLRNPGEADRIHALGGTVVWVDAEPKMRYQRVQANRQLRDREGEDAKTFEQFMAEESIEMERQGDAATLDMSAVKQKSNVKLNNSDENIDKFRQHLEKMLGF